MVRETASGRCPATIATACELERARQFVVMPPVELVRRVTGHATVEVVLKHYFRPDREQFRAALVGSMPAVLTGEGQSAVGSGQLAGGSVPCSAKATQGKQLAELAELAQKVAAGTATEAERKRLRALAGKL